MSRSTEGGTRTPGRRGLLAACALFLLLAGAAPLRAQVELLPLEHPAVRALVRIYEYGSIPEFPREHLPISRRLALTFLREAAGDARLPDLLRSTARYYITELAADEGRTEPAVLIKTSDGDHSIFDGDLGDRPLAFLTYRDTTRGVRLAFEPVFDAEFRTAPDDDLTAIIVQGGAQLRGTIAERVGFSARITNGTVAGDSDLVLRDPKFGHSAKFGVARQNRDADFGNGHLRADFDVVSAEIGRERVQLGGGMDESLLLGSILPSNYDYLRLNARLGRVTFSHIHASLLARHTGFHPFGPETVIPPKYVATHLISFGPFGGIRGSIGEAVVYSGRPFEIGYINPLNFMKSQEHYLRDRDNSFIYASLSANPVDGIFLEGEFMLDDLKFSEIGENFHGNKTAWKIGASAVAFPLPAIDLALSYTRIEPYTYAHTNPVNAYAHDGTPLAAAGLQPNSYMVEGKISVSPLPNLWIRAGVGVGEHGANEIDEEADTIVRNVGGDVEAGRRGVDSFRVTFLDGVLERLFRFRADAEYEPWRNIYLRLTFLGNRINAVGTKREDTQLWLGARVGVR